MRSDRSSRNQSSLGRRSAARRRQGAGHATKRARHLQEDRRIAEQPAFHGDAMPRSFRFSSVVFAATTLAALGASAHAQSIADFYRGKTINVVIGFTPGGTYDLYARTVTQFMGDHIPGKPRIVPRNMPGGGSRTAAGYVAKVAPKDGTVLATASQGASDRSRRSAIRRCNSTRPSSSTSAIPNPTTIRRRFGRRPASRRSKTRRRARSRSARPATRNRRNIRK